MKKLSFLFFSLALASARADTNIFPVLTTLDGISYTNARVDHVTPIYADVWHDNGIVHIALTNLSEPLRSQYPYDSNKAAAFIAEEKQKTDKIKGARQVAAAARQAWLEEQAKKAGWIYVVDCDKDSNPYIFTAYISGAYRKIYINNAPTKIINSPYAGRALLESMDAFNTMREANFYHDSDERALAREENKQSQTDELKAEDDERIRAFYTGTFYNGLPVWQYVGPITAKTQNQTNSTK